MSSPNWNPGAHGPGLPPPARPQNGGWEYGAPPAGPGAPWPGPAWGQSAAPEPAGPDLAGFGRRLAARAIDYVLVFVAAIAFFVIMILVTVVLTGSEESTDAEGGVWALLLFFGWGLLLFFYDWLYLVAWGRTLGKMMVGIKVVSASDGGRLTQGQAMGRSALFGLPQTLPGFGHLFSLGESLALLGDKRSRALHDRAAGTVVVLTV